MYTGLALNLSKRTLKLQITTIYTPHTFTLPLVNGGTFDFIVAWGDGSTNTHITAYNVGNAHSYATPGTYTIMIWGVCTKFNFNASGSAPYVIKILDFVDTGLITLDFKGCTKLTIASNNIKRLNSLTNMPSTFYGCTNLVNAPIIGTNVTGMFSTFQGCTNLVNAPTIPNKVTNMPSTFSGCTNLVNAPVIPANVTDMSSTFQGCTNLAGNITVVNIGVTSFTDCFTGCNASIAKTLRCPTGSASYNLAFNICHGKNGVTLVAY